MEMLNTAHCNLVKMANDAQGMAKEHEAITVRLVALEAKSDQVWLKMRNKCTALVEQAEITPMTAAEWQVHLIELVSALNQLVE